MKQIPLYSISTFIHGNKPFYQPYLVEVFDKNRHFDVVYPHRHDFYEILFIIKGSGFYQIDFNKYELLPNTIFFVSPGQVHEIQFSDDVFGFIFLFTGDFYLINKTDKNILNQFPFFDNLKLETKPLNLDLEKNIAFIQMMFSKAADLSSENEYDIDDEIRAILDLILMFCKRNYPQTQIENKLKKGKNRLSEFQNLIQKNYLQNWTLKQYADILNITPNHLNEIVKFNTGTTATALIDQKIILEIKRVLLHTDLNVTEIAQKFGFEDQSYFSRFFKRHVGVSPKEYKKTISS